MLGISGFIYFKTQGENTAVVSGFWFDLKKKTLQRKMPQFSPDFDVIFKKNLRSFTY